MHVELKIKKENIMFMHSLLLLICFLSSYLVGMDTDEKQSTYKALVTLGEMQVIAQSIKPDEYENILKTYNITPQAMAASTRYLQGIETAETKEEIAYFQNRKDYNYSNYIQTAVEILQQLKNKSEKEGVTSFDWASTNMIRILRATTEEEQRSLKSKKNYNECLKQRIVILYLGSALVGFVGMIMLFGRTACH